MDYTSIHIYGHLLSDDILHEIETDTAMVGNREQDFNLDVVLTAKIDNAWSSLRNDWQLFSQRNTLRDPYGTSSVRRLMERFFSSLDYQLDLQPAQVESGERKYNIPYLCPEIDNMPIIIVGDKSGDEALDTLEKCTLDIRTKGDRRQKSPQATMLDYLNNTENVYGIVSNGHILRLIRNTGQLVKLTYIEFDLRRMVEEDHYAEFTLMFRLLHASRFTHGGDDACPMEQWFNRSVESGNRIRAGLSNAVQKAMEILGNAVVRGHGQGNEDFRQKILNGEADAKTLNKELIHFIYRLLFLFIIEDRNLVYDIGEPDNDKEYDRKVRCQEIYTKYYAVSRLRRLSELPFVRSSRYHDLWDGLMDSFRLFEDETFGAPLLIKPLGGVLFSADTLKNMRPCLITNKQLLTAFAYLNEFRDERQNRVKINYSSLDVEEFGSVYEGILEMSPYISPSSDSAAWNFGYAGGLDRKSTSSYYTRPDLVQSLIRTTLEPVIKERIARGKTTEEKVRSLLSMKVCDAASGSGHIVLAMARTIAWYVCALRTGEENSASLDYRNALREVISRCVYAVDLNPDAVELCKVVLWIEGYCAGKPLSFLDHHIRCGNSVVGVSDLQMLIDGVPDKAFVADDKETLKALKKLNASAVDAVNGIGDPALGLDDPFGVEGMDAAQIGLADKVMMISHLPENTLTEEMVKQEQWEELMRSARVDCLRRACDIYTCAFYHTVHHEELFIKDNEWSTERINTEAEIPYTKTVVRALQEVQAMECLEKGKPLPTYYRQLSSKFKTTVINAAAKQRYFHWCVEFPEVFAGNKGFDVMCGNPPWDKIKVEDRKWFESHGRTDIVNAGTAAQRKQAIADLPVTDPALYEAYTESLADADATSRFVRFGKRFSLTATGDIDLYPMFAELCLTFSKEAWGLVLPIGIAVNDSNKLFFSKLIDDNRLISLYDFENREKLFAIDSRSNFCLLTSGKPQEKPRTVNGGFYLTRLDHLLDPRRIYTLQTSDFTRLNPNTKTCPVFRTSRDAELTAKIYRNSTILLNENSGENPWNVRFARMLDMSNDSHLFRTYAQLTNAGATFRDGVFVKGDDTYVPLYEGKMIWHYNHHYGTWPTEGTRPNAINPPSLEELQDPSHCIMPWYWVPLTAVIGRLSKYDNENKLVWEWKHHWLMAFRDISNATNERTFISSFVPLTGMNNKIPYVAIEQGPFYASMLLALTSSIVFDYVVRQKVGGTSMNFFYVKQFPVLTPEQIPIPMQWQVVKRVAELTYFNHDMDGWAEELWEEMNDEQRADLPQLGEKQPWIFDPERRALLQAELDAIFAHLYGLSTEDLRYILDPEDVCGEGCINETFRVLRDNEMRQFGEYRTKRLVLEVWHRFGFDRFCMT